MNNFTKRSGRAYWHSITNLFCCSPNLKRLQSNGIKAVMLLVFFTLSSSALLAQNPNEGGGFLAGTIDGCMNDVPAATSVDELMKRSDFDACRASNEAFLLEPNTEFDTPGVWGFSSGFTQGSTDCSWTFYYVYTLKCAGEIQPYTVQYNGGDATQPKLRKGAVIPPGAKDLNLCYNEAPAATPVEDIAALFTDNCDHIKVEEYVTMRTKTKSDDCKWIVIYVYTIWDGCTEPVEISITYTGGDTQEPWFTSELPAKEITVDCDNIPDPVTLSWADNCTTGKLKVKSVDDTSKLGIGCEGGVITRTWDIHDDCGNSTSYTQTINVNPAPQAYFEATQDVYVPCAEKADVASYIPDLRYSNGRDSDRCGIYGIAKPNYTEIAESCGSFEVTYTFTDDCGRTSNASLTVYIVDDINPSILKAADDMTVECDGEGNIEQYNAWLANNGGAMAEDNCDNDLTWSNDDASHPFSDDCGATGQKTVIFTVTDDCGNASKTFATFYIVDTTKPVGEPAQDLRVQCDGEGNTNQYQVWINNHGGATATDDCSGVTWSHDGPVFDDKYYNLTDFDQFIRDCSEFTGYVRVTFRATDDCGNYTESTADFIIEDSIAPNISTPASDVTVECDGSLFDINDTTAFDEGKLQARTYGNNNAAQLYEWVFITHGGAIADPDACSDIKWLIEGTITGDYCDINFNVTFTAIDACGNATSTSATFHVIDTNSPAIGQEAQDMVVECAGGFDDQINEAAATAEGPNYNMYQFYNWLRNNGGAYAIDACSDIRWSNDYDGKSFTDECGNTGRITVLFTATDMCGLSSTTAAEFIIQDTTVPTFTAPQNTTIYKDATCSYDARPVTTGDVYDEWDNCNVYDLQATYSDKLTDGDCPGSNLLIRTWSLVDECGNKADDQVQLIKIIDNTPPVLTGTLPPSMSNLDLCESPVGPSEADVAAAYTDNCTAVVVTKTTNTVQTGECGWATQFTYEISDECGNMLDPIKILYWGSDQSAPELAPNMSLPKDNFNLTTCLDEALMGDGAGATVDEVYKLFTDNCDTDVTVTKSEPDFISQGCDYHYIYTFTVTDNCDNTYTFKQHFAGSDKNAPVLVGTIPLDVSDINECMYEAMDGTASGPTEADIAALYEECSGYGNVNVDKVTNAFGDDCNWIISHEYTIYDDCGNYADAVKITYSGADKDAPMFDLNQQIDTILYTYDDDADCPASADITLNVGDVISVFDTWFVAGVHVPSLNNQFFTSVYDDCTADSDLIIRVVDVTNSKDSCNNLITVTFEAEDSCGNVSADTFTCKYTVVDDTPPTATAPADVVVECAGDVPAPNVKDITDEADDCNSTTVTFVKDETDGGFPVELITRTYKIEDACGNAIEVTQQIKVEDTTAPEITCSGDIIVNGNANGAIVTYDAPAFSDNCDSNPKLTLQKGFASGDVFPVGDTVVKYKVKDASGNFAVCTFVVTVVDTTPTKADSGDISMSTELDFRAYPVPFNKDVTLKYNFNFDTNVTIEVYDTRGLLVLRKNVKGYRSGSDMNLPLSITGSEQLYYVKLITNRGTVIKKIVSSNVNKR